MYQRAYIDIVIIKKISTADRLVINMDFDSEIAEQYFERGKNRIIFEKYSEAIELNFIQMRRFIPKYFLWLITLADSPTKN